MKVNWKQFAQRRKLNIKAFREMSYEDYSRWCNHRNVNPVPFESFVGVQNVVQQNESLIEDLEVEIITGSSRFFEESKLKKLRKSEIQEVCRKFSIEYESVDTKKVLIDKLLLLNKS